MWARVVKTVTRGLMLLLVAAVLLLGVRAYDARRGPPLEPWHTYVPAELSAEALESSDWNAYLEAEDRIFESVRAEVTGRLGPQARVPINRYFDGSPLYAPHLA